MTKLDLFPLGVATGSAHCNRVAERQLLKQHILGITHTWLWARRRMGKTSLIQQVLQDLARSRRKVVAMTLDLLLVHDAEELEKRIRSGVEQLAVDVLPKRQRKTTQLAKAFAELGPQFSVGAAGLQLRLARADSLPMGIAEMLMGLDRAAGDHKRRVLIVLDEFQQLTQLKYGETGHTLEGAIRHAVERAQNVVYLFAGSQRHLLASMFEDEDRPLFQLCHKMTLGRIGVEDYRDFIRTASKARWRRLLSDDMIDQILNTTTRHPYYLNALCARLWKQDRPPTAERISIEWRALIEENKSVVAGKVLRLSLTQRAMLKGIALAPAGVEHPTSLEFLSTIRLPTSTGNRAKDVLEEGDLIQQDDDGRWILVDPLMADYVRSM